MSAILNRDAASGLQPSSDLECGGLGAACLALDLYQSRRAASVWGGDLHIQNREPGGGCLLRPDSGDDAAGGRVAGLEFAAEKACRIGWGRDLQIRKTGGARRGV